VSNVKRSNSATSEETRHLDVDEGRRGGRNREAIMIEAVMGKYEEKLRTMPPCGETPTSTRHLPPFASLASSSSDRQHRSTWFHA
jgi:hypothetical protein